MELPARYIQIWGFSAYVSSNPGIFHVCSLRSKTGPHKYHISMNTSVPRGWSSWNAALAGLDSKIGDAQTSWVTQLRMRVAPSICLHVMWPTERSDHIDPRDWKCLADQEGIFILSYTFYILSIYFLYTLYISIIFHHFPSPSRLLRAFYTTKKGRHGIAKFWPRDGPWPPPGPSLSCFWCLAWAKKTYFYNKQITSLLNPINPIKHPFLN